MNACGSNGEAQKDYLTYASPEVEPSEVSADLTEKGNETASVEQEDAADGTSAEAQDDQISSDSEFKIYFIDVGQADSSLIICDEHTLLIDGGNTSDSSLIYSFLKSHNINHLDYIIGTHAHEDHIGGLAGALNYASVDVAYCPVTSYDSKAFGNFVKYLDKQGVSISVPTPGDRFLLGSAEVMVLGPIRDNANPNNTSIVTKVTYGNTSFLFTGDAEREEEADILDMGYDLFSNLLHVGHHGSDTSSTYPFLREIMPQYAVISVGKDNSYGHPHENLLSRLRDAGAEVYRTDMQGTITCVSDGKALYFETEKIAVQTNPTIEEKAHEQEAAKKEAASTNSTEYIGNKNSKKFHLPTCRTLPKEANRVYFDTRQDAINGGYAPCKNCNP